MDSIQLKPLSCKLSALESSEASPAIGDRLMEFHVHASIRSTLGLDSALFKSTGTVILPDFASARAFAHRLREKKRIAGKDTSSVSAGRINALGLIDEILHEVFRIYREKAEPAILENLAQKAKEEVGEAGYGELLRRFGSQFPVSDVYRGLSSPEDWLASSSPSPDGSGSVSNALLALEELILLKLANENPAFGPYRFLFDDGLGQEPRPADSLGARPEYEKVVAALEKASASAPGLKVGDRTLGLFDILRMPAKEAPESLEAQLAWIRTNWGLSLGGMSGKLLAGLDLIAEEETPRFPPGPGPVKAYTYSSGRKEYEKFSSDQGWMPSTVLIAKNVLVWLHQLSVDYGLPISRLDQIPDKELDTLAQRGLTALWLIGLWKRSAASEKIKRSCGNPEAAASAYSLFDYEIEPSLGGWEALDSLRERCMWRGIRLAADMVPNHTGIDSSWVRDRPELFIGSERCPFPGYTFHGPDLSEDPSVGIWLEDHYYSRTDAAVVFKRMDRRTGAVRYIYHGNDGTGMAWNDTAQIDFLNPEARAAVKERILHVARHFNIIRFDAAMVLASQHIRRLWYPAPGSGGAIPSRSEYAMSDEAFDRALPHEFWREVVDECAQKAPDTLLLAEAFWMMEGYFVRTLGMHRVYNSAFMNMLKEEKNSLYRLTIKNTQEFDPQILKRFVNFMSNPDEETAVAQFGKGDKYFGVCSMMATMPGLPMFGHGQIEGFTEKYGMEYRRSYKDEKPDADLIARHEREIFPLLHMRALFADAKHFSFFDFSTEAGHIDENVFAYSNGEGEERALVIFNNHWERTRGRIALSAAYLDKAGANTGHLRKRSLAQALGFNPAPGNYLAARELRSGLWHLKDCQELNAQGWSLALEGFQCLVFTTFERMVDFDGSCRRLCDSLGGRPVEDLDEALEEAARPELYHSLQSVVGAIDRFAALLSRPMESPGASETKAEVLAAGEQFLSRLSQALAEETNPRPGISAVQKTVETLGAGLSAFCQASGQGTGKTDFFLPMETIASSLADEGHARALVRFLFLQTLSLLSPGANRSEELRYILEKYLIKKRMLGTVADALAFAFASRPRETPMAFGPEDRPSSRAAELMRWATQDGEASAALGINTWEGKVYFNAERFSSMLELWPLFALIEEETHRISRPIETGARIDPRDYYKKMLAIHDAAEAAIPASGYLVDKLLDALEASDRT